MAAGAVSLRKSHDIVILSFCNIVKGQANCEVFKTDMMLVTLKSSKHKGPFYLEKQTPYCVKRKLVSMLHL